MDYLDKYLSQLQFDINNALIGDVADGAKETMQNVIDDVVYKSYNPTVYSRRGDNGGLSDKRNMIVSAVPNGILLTNEAPVNYAYGVSHFAGDKRLSEIICEGRDNYM
ncbi:MAG: hypothetical protein RR728_08170, partial [Oscillospiraceae bacterium]